MPTTRTTLDMVHEVPVVADVLISLAVTSHGVGDTVVGGCIRRRVSPSEAKALACRAPESGVPLKYILYKSGLLAQIPNVNPPSTTKEAPVM